MLIFVVKLKDNLEKNNYHFKPGFLLLTILIAKLGGFVHGLGLGFVVFGFVFFLSDSGLECVVYTFREI